MNCEVVRLVVFVCWVGANKFFGYNFEEHRGYVHKNPGHYRKTKNREARRRLSRDENDRVKELLGRRRRAKHRRDKET